MNSSLMVLACALLAVAVFRRPRSEAARELPAAPAPHLPAVGQEPQTLTDFIEGHRGTVSALGLFLGFGSLLAGPTAEPYALAAFGFMGVVLLHELHERAPRRDVEPLASFRKALFVALVAVFFAWTGALASADPLFAILPYTMFVLWIGRLARVRDWPGRPLIDILVLVLSALPLPLLAVRAIEALSSFYIQLHRLGGFLRG